MKKKQSIGTGQLQLDRMIIGKLTNRQMYFIHGGAVNKKDQPPPPPPPPTTILSGFDCTSKQTG